MRDIQCRSLKTGLVLCTLLWATCVCPAQGSTVVPMELQTLADLAGQVIVGRVANVRSYWADAPRRIESQVTFEQVEYLKGALPDSTTMFTLIVPGGTVDETRMEVCCAPSFAVGQTWVLFLLPEYRAHPVVGLYQGSFFVQPDAEGVERVYQRRHDRLEPVVGFDPDGFAQVARSEHETAQARLVDANRLRLVPTEPRGSPPVAMALPDFLAHIQPVAAASKDHHLTQAAGRRLGSPQQASPLVPAGAQPGSHELSRLRGAATPRQEPRTPQDHRMPSEGSRP